MEVYVVINVELGWDCVCGVFSGLKTLAEYLADEEEDFDEDGELKESSPYFGATFEELYKLISDSSYIIHKERLN